LEEFAQYCFSIKKLVHIRFSGFAAIHTLFIVRTPFHKSLLMGRRYENKLVESRFAIDRVAGHRLDSPPPAGLKLNAWYYFAIFAAVVVALVLEPIPNAAVGLIGVTMAVVMGYVFAKPGDSLRWGLSGFSNSTVWLIFGAFMISLGYEKTGLGRRIALLLVRVLGGKTLGLGYAITLADLAIAPGTPSNTARSAGTIYPIIRNIPALFGSEPGPTSRKIGAYLMWTAFTATAITSSMFITSMAVNPLASHS